MTEFQLKYGCNPNQTPARIFMEGNQALPLTIRNGKPGYINFLDALNSWQLVKELKEALGLAAATSFKHVSPTAAAVGTPMNDTLKKACFVEDIPGLDDSPIALAYAKARGTDRMCSFGDWIALSEPCDEVTAAIIHREVSDGIIAPGYSDKALDILKSKRKGGYNILEIDPHYVPQEKETKQVFGITFEQGRNHVKIDTSLLQNIPTANKTLSASAQQDMIIALITLKYTQSNSVCYVKEGQVIGVGAGQQSRIHCTRLAGNKADIFHLRQHERVLGLPFLPTVKRPDRDNAIDVYLSDEWEDLLADGIWEGIFAQKPTPLTTEEKKAYLKTIQGVTLGSDAFFPFGDNVERASKSGVSYIVQPGGSMRDDAVIAVCDAHQIAMACTGVRLFHH